MISRRDFLVWGARALGAWLVGPEAAGRILQLAREKNEPYLVEVESAREVLWANRTGDGYLFTLGTRLDDAYVPELTWRDWLRRRGVDLTKPGEIRDCLENHGLWDPESRKRFEVPALDESVPQSLFENYLEWEYSMHDSDTAQAYHFLDRLELADRKARPGPWGALKFEEGPCPGNNASLVSTSEVETLGALQQRLLQLGKQVQIRVA